MVSYPLVAATATAYKSQRRSRASSSRVDTPSPLNTITGRMTPDLCDLGICPRDSFFNSADLFCEGSVHAHQVCVHSSRRGLAFHLASLYVNAEDAKEFHNIELIYGSGEACLYDSCGYCCLASQRVRIDSESPCEARYIHRKSGCMDERVLRVSECLFNDKIKDFLKL
jgi:hypothetical protein